MAETVVIAGAIAQKPWRGGHTWVILQYLLGFRQLGWEVVFLDWIAPESCVDDDGRTCPVEGSANLQYLLDVLTEVDLHEHFALIQGARGPTIGLPRQQVIERVREAALLLNVNGFLVDEEVLAAARRRVYVDIDPGFGQIWQHLGLHDPFRGHDDFVTIGANIGQPDCAIPTGGRNWITIRPPVVLDHWRAVIGYTRERFTSVATWRGAYGPLEYEGTTYGLRVHEFRKFAELPRRTAQQFELALDIHAADQRDRDLLVTNGWHLVDPRTVAGDPWTYRTYLQGSLAEFGVAKGIYVQSKSGWFSDRSACYLASGKPVVVQDTGLGRHYPIGDGLLTYETIDQAAACVDAVAADYARHALAARAIAEEVFRSDVVLRQLLDELGLA